VLQITLLNNHAIYINFWQFAFYNSCLVVLENFKTVACRKCCMYKIKHYDWNIWKVCPFTFIWWDLKGNCRVCVLTYYQLRYSNFCTLVKKNWNYVWTKEDNCVESFPFCRKLSRLFAVPLTKSVSLLSNYMWSRSTFSRFSIWRLFCFILFYIILLYFVGWIVLLRNSVSLSCQWQKTAWNSVQQFLSLKPAATSLV
jgi:hypothetical protein